MIRMCALCAGFWPLFLVPTIALSQSYYDLEGWAKVEPMIFVHKNFFNELDQCRMEPDCDNSK